VLPQEKKHILLRKEHRLNELKDRHTIALGNYKKTIKEQLFSNQDAVSRNVTESLINVQSASARHHREAGLQQNNLHEISTKIATSVSSHEDFKTAMRQWSNDMTTDLRDSATHRIASLAAYSEKQFKSTREQNNVRLKQELKELESHHDGKIADAMEENKQEIYRLRKSWNVTINDNLDLISRLRNNVADFRETDRCTRKILHDMQNQNSNIVVPLESKQKSLQQLNYDLDSYQVQKQDLDTQKQKLRHAEAELKEIEWNHEVLFQKLEALQKDHHTQKKRFHQAIYSAQQQSNFTNMLLEERIRKLSKKGDKSTAAIIEILQRANIDIDAIENSKVQLSDVIKDKNNTLQALQEELKSITAAKLNMVKKSQDLVDRYSSNRSSKVNVKS
jgi:chromosome segregation ATPase